MKIKFNSDDNLPFSKPLKFHLMTIAIKLIKQIYQKNVIFVIIGILKIEDLNMDHIFAMAVMI